MTKPPPKPKPKASSKAGARAKPKPQAPATPVRYSQQVCDQICTLLTEGHSLRSICSLAGMPTVTSVMRWLGEDAHSDFREQYARAREAQADRMAEDILAIADEQCTMIKADKHGSRDDDGDGNTEVVFDPTAVARNRLRVDARKWLASKMAPKKYGDKIEAVHTGPDGGAVQISSTVTFVRPPVRSED
jgi:hypothetical protein